MCGVSPILGALMNRLPNVRCSTASQRTEPYKSESRPAAIIAITQGALCALIVGESVYG